MSGPMERSRRLCDGWMLSKRWRSSEDNFRRRRLSAPLATPIPTQKKQSLDGSLRNMRILTKAQPGSALVRRKIALSPLEIADLAQTMLESLGGPPGDQLLDLVQQLLHVDRHRKQLANTRGEPLEQAASFEAQVAIQGQKASARQIAKIVGVTQPTISGWKKLPTYKSKVELYKEFWMKQLSPFIKQAELETPDASKEYLMHQAYVKFTEELKKRNPTVELVSGPDLGAISKHLR